MKFLLLLASALFITSVSVAGEECAPIYDSDDGSIVNSHCAKPKVQVKETRSPASEENFESEPVDNKDSGYEKPMDKD